MSYFSDVLEFHQEMGLETNPQPRLLPVQDFQRRMRLILEELSETIAAQVDENLIEVADGLADLTYVVLGTAVEMGLPFERVWNEVHSSNMSKTGGTLDKGGKLIKPDTYRPADLSFLVEQ